MGNCSCAACDQACPAPPVDASIGFFDGFDGALVAIVYGALILFSIIYQIIRVKFLSKYNTVEEGDLDENLNDGGAAEYDNPYPKKNRRHKDKINNSEVSSSAANNSQLIVSGARFTESNNNVSVKSPNYNN